MRRTFTFRTCLAPEKIFLVILLYPSPRILPEPPSSSIFPNLLLFPSPLHSIFFSFHFFPTSLTSSLQHPIISHLPISTQSIPFFILSSPYFLPSLLPSLFSSTSFHSSVPPKTSLQCPTHSPYLPVSPQSRRIFHPPQFVPSPICPPQPFLPKPHLLHSFPSTCHSLLLPTPSLSFHPSPPPVNTPPTAIKSSPVLP